MVKVKVLPLGPCAHHHNHQCPSSSFMLLNRYVGWFHEVTSFPLSSGEVGPETSEAGRGGHQAVNYWFHPPDNLDPSRKGFLRYGYLLCVELWLNELHE